MKTTVRLFFVLTLVTGVVYPAAVTGISQLLFAREANGQTDLIGQSFTRPEYFWSRPSATAYNAMASSGSNLGPSNPALIEQVTKRVTAASIPIDLVTTSGSGLDPHISPEGARFQVARVAATRGMTVESVTALIVKHTEERFVGIFGEQRVNVLLLNLALDRAAN